MQPLNPSSRKLVPVISAGLVGLVLGLAVHLHAQPAPPPGPAEADAGGPPGPRGPAAPPRPPDAPPVDLQKADAALKVGVDASGALAPGQLWTQTGPAGDQHVDATVLYQNKAVARLRFSPADGSLLPEGYDPAPPTQSTASSSTATVSDATLAKIRSELPAVVSGLKALPAVAVAGREGFWRIPVVYQDRIVANLMISGDATQVVEDFGAARDAAIYAR